MVPICFLYKWRKTCALSILKVFFSLFYFFAYSVSDFFNVSVFTMEMKKKCEVYVE